MKATRPLVTALLAIALQNTFAQVTNWSVEAGGNDHYYEAVLVPGGVTWNNASLIASNRGGYLATISSSNENAFVFGLVSHDTNFWILRDKWYGPWLGGVQLPGSPEPAGGWTWVTGEPFTYTNWGSGQPNNNQTNLYGNENRIQFLGQTAPAGTWNDVNETNSPFVRSFIIEYPNPSLAIRAWPDSQVEISWSTRMNWFYQMQYRSNLTFGGWNDWGARIQGNGSTNSIYDPVMPGQMQRFYHVAVSPQ